MNNIDFAYLYTSTEGRIGRQSFWIGVVGFLVVGLVLSLVLGAIFGMASLAGTVLSFIVQLIFAYPAYALMAKRFQDRDKPGTWAAVWVGISLLFSLLGLFGLTGDPMAPNWFGTLFSVVLLIFAIWILVELGFLRGTIGPNNYGADPVGEPGRM
jgi:uncharacterized membrane protein YhaH (DUF805 family)